MVKCLYCGTENVDEEVFCEECGRLLKKSERKKILKKYKTVSPGNFTYVSSAQIIV